MPKPLVPLVDRPSLDHVLDHLRRHGVHEVVLSSSYHEEPFRSFIRARRGDPEITWITEEMPLGTGGAIANALDALASEEAFLALNGDILTDLDITAMRERHAATGATATIALTRVEDARPFGLVATDADGRVLEFREKPRDPIPGDVNAGTYLLDPDAVRGWSTGEPVSIEREIFPSLIADGRPVFGFVSDAYWRDLGTPDQYLQAHVDLLDGRVRGQPAYPAPFLAAGASVAEGASVASHVVVGPGAAIEAGAEVADSVLLEGARVGERSRVRRSILGPSSIVSAGAIVEDSVLGAGAVLEPDAVVRDGRIGPGQRVSSA
jgi:mannose-1-phosphate guanylyltransferase